MICSPHNSIKSHLTSANIGGLKTTQKRKMSAFIIIDDFLNSIANKTDLWIYPQLPRQSHTR